MLKGVVAFRQIAMEFPQSNRHPRDYVTRHISDGHVVCHDTVANFVVANSPDMHSRMCFFMRLNVIQSGCDFFNARSRIASIAVSEATSHAPAVFSHSNIKLKR
jgi:hypothetical protein